MFTVKWEERFIHVNIHIKKLSSAQTEERFSSYFQVAPNVQILRYCRLILAVHYKDFAYLPIFQYIRLF